MLQKNKSKSGFTIIEVLIVLAIAGLILLIVFLAVPALQRNAHNTAAKNDVASVLGAMTEYTNNNNGSLPANAAGTTGATSYQVGGTTCPSTASCTKVSLGYYDAGKVSVVSAVPATFPAEGEVVVVKGAVCNGNAASTTGASPRNFVALYTLEGGAKQCQAS